MGRANLNALLGSQNYDFNKVGLGYKPSFQGKVKQFKSFFFNLNKMHTSPFISYLYCMKRGHTIRSCRVRKHDIPNGLVRWVPKSANERNNNTGPN